MNNIIYKLGFQYFVFELNSFLIYINNNNSKITQIYSDGKQLTLLYS